MGADVGGPSHLGFSERDAKNVMKRKRIIMYGRDINTLLHFFSTKRQVDTLFSYRVQIDDDNRWTSYFWVDGKSKEDYMAFSDVVYFDTIYKTKEYDMPFGTFFGVNNHMQTILFGACLLFGETVDDFKWLFQTWLDAMSGVHPKTIITNQDATIGAAIAAVFPNANHILCLWHIQKKLSKKLSDIIHEHPTFKASWNHCLYDTKSVDDYESCWHAMIEEFNLHNNSWLRHMFEIRHQWIPAYTNRIFSAGIKTTGSGSINAFFNGFVNHKSSLMDFANGYDKALKRRREIEEHADFQTSNGRPVLKTEYSIEAQMANVYTLNVFLVFQKELEESLHYIAERVENDGILQHWQVYQFEEHTGSKHNCISWNVEEMVASCSCMKFESCGIVCRHIITLFRFMQVVSMPPSHVLPRWTKTIKAQFKHAYIFSDNIATQPRAIRDHAFGRWWSYIRQKTLDNSDMFEIVREHVEKMIVALQALPRKACTETRRREDGELDNRPTGAVADNLNLIGDESDNVVVNMFGVSSGTLASHSSQPYDLLDSHVVHTKGRTSKRIKGPLEQPLRRVRLCRGCNKRVVGHDKRNCPFLKDPAPTDGFEQTSDVSTARSRGQGRRGGTN